MGFNDLLKQGKASGSILVPSFPRLITHPSSDQGIRRMQRRNVLTTFLPDLLLILLRFAERTIIFGAIEDNRSCKFNVPLRHHDKEQKKRERERNCNNVNLFINSYNTSNTP